MYHTIGLKGGPGADKTEVTLDGKPLNSVKAVEVEVEHGTLNRVFLTMLANVDVDVAGIVEGAEPVEHAKKPVPPENFVYREGHLSKALKERKKRRKGAES